MKWAICAMIGLGVAVLFPAMSSGQPLIIGTAEWRPWQIVEENRVTGITPDILQALSGRTGYAMTIKAMPHKRLMVQFEKQQIAVEPTVNPLWREDQKDISVYTKPYFTTWDIILVRKESGIKATSWHDFKGLSLGCGLGYYYPEGFNEAFRKGDILREDNPAGENNLMKLALKRIHGAIVDNVQANYMFNRCGLNPDDFEIAYQFQPSKLCLRLHKSRQDLLPALNEGIDSLTADGTIDRIVMKYSP